MEKGLNSSSQISNGMRLCDRRICIIGARGVGKSHAVRSAIVDFPGWKHVVGSDILRRHMAARGVERMSILDSVGQDILRQFASEEMVDLASSGCEGFICEGHAALLADDTVPWYTKAFRRLLVLLGLRTSIYESQRAFTELDKSLFNEVILMEADPEVIRQRRMGDSTKVRSIDMEAIRADIAAERDAAASICRESGATLRVVDANIESLRDATIRRILEQKHSFIETVSMYHQQKIISKARSLPIPASGSPIFLFDADGTLGPHDASKVLIPILNKQRWAEVKENFKRGYSHYSFVMHEHLHLLENDERFHALIKEAGKVMPLYPGVKECLLKALQRGPVVVLTAGIPEVWRQVLQHNGIHGVRVFGLVDFEESLVMDEQGKETFAKEVKRMGYHVVAMGDGQIDTGMLRAADAAFIISRKPVWFAEHDLSKRRPLTWRSSKADHDELLSHRMILLLGRHPRLYQVAPETRLSLIVPGPCPCDYKDLVEAALDSPPPSRTARFEDLLTAFSDMTSNT